MQSMTIEQEWLSQILSEQTRESYSRSLRYFKEFLGLNSVEDIINLRKQERNFETRIIQFYQWLQKNKGVSDNSARNIIIAEQSLFSYLGLPIKIKNKLPRMHIKLELWKPSIEEIQRLYKFADISAKAWISLSRDVPARISDLLRITNEQIQSGEFLLQSKKENVVGKCYISEETKLLFTQLENAKISLPKSQRGIDLMIEQACKVANLPKRINQHLWRKIFISTGINLGIQDTIVKILTFKSVPPEMLTYFLDREELRQSWEKIVNAIPLEAKSENAKVSDMQMELAELKSALRTLAKFMNSKKGNFEDYLKENEELRVLLEEKEQ